MATGLRQKRVERPPEGRTGAVERRVGFRVYPRARAKIRKRRGLSAGPQERFLQERHHSRRRISDRPQGKIAGNALGEPQHAPTIEQLVRMLVDADVQGYGGGLFVKFVDRHRIVRQSQPRPGRSSDRHLAGVKAHPEHRGQFPHGQ